MTIPNGINKYGSQLNIGTLKPSWRSVSTLFEPSAFMIIRMFLPVWEGQLGSQFSVDELLE